tara:strand:- start:131 stop:634 length:504 start_codon:yes stop_codon:yes gene_type:complete
MREVEITLEMIDTARTKAKELGTLRNSISKGRGNLVGFIGEEVAQTCLGGTVANTYDYDIVLSDGSTVDVKTKSTSVKPLSHYDCSVSAYNTKQKCDAYAFVRVKHDLSIGWYLGIMQKETYMDTAEMMRKGEIDPSNGFKIKADCYNVKISQLQDKLCTHKKDHQS